MKFVKGIAMLLCLVTIFTSVWVGNLGIGAEDGGDKVTVTVKYVYKSNGYMVTQPYTAQISKGTDFTKTIEIPHLLNYSIPVDVAIVSVGSEEKKLHEYSEIVLAEKDNTISFDLKAVTEDIAVTLYYVAGKGKYTVNHYLQNLENDEYTLDSDKTATVEGDIDAYTEAVADNIPGYHCKGVEQSSIAADGTTKVDIYYDRDFYTVVFDVNGGVNGPKPIYAKFGTTFEANDIEEPTRKGYIFLGWSPVLSDTVTIEKNITYVAQWQAEKGQADYTIVIWGQNANDDEYSYLGSAEAWGNVGNQVRWEDNPLINHVHTDECGAKYCKLEEHTHSKDELDCSHIHDLTCYGLNLNAHDEVIPNSEAIKYFTQLGLQSGKIFYFDDNGYNSDGDKYYLYLDGKYYEYPSKPLSNIGTQLAESECDEGLFHATDYFYKYDLVITCTHIHTDNCYSCGKTEHTHSEHCCGITDTAEKRMQELHPGSNLWEFEWSETVTVNADGSTVLNVYFKRVEFTLNFRDRNSSSNDYGTIKARWGKDISAEYQAIVANAKTSFWSRNRNGSQPWTNYIGIMPQVTIKAKMGDKLYQGMQNNYFPNLTSTSVTIEKDNQEIIIYYKAAQEVEYTVKYQDKNGNDLIPPVKKTTKDAIVTEKYVPIPNYAPRQDSITLELKAEGNVIVFIYDPTLTKLVIRKTGFDAIDTGTTFIFHIKGTDDNTKDIDLRVTIHGYVMGDLVPYVTIADLPVGSYTVTEESDWSWRYEPKNGKQTITLDSVNESNNVLTFDNERKDGQWLSDDTYNTNSYTTESN